MYFKHFYIFLHLLYFYCEIGNSQNLAQDECDNIKKSYNVSAGNYIVAGTDAATGEIPFQAALGKFTEKNTSRFFCGGSLVSPTCVLTAAHCITSQELEKKEPFVVRLGSTDISNKTWNDETDHIITKIKVHENYEYKKSFYNDLAVICFDDPITYNDKVMAICLDTSTTQPEGTLTISGWGHTRFGGMMNNKLLKGKVEAVDQDTCKATYGKGGLLPRGFTSDLICVKDPRRKQDTCKGDSGGPLTTGERENRILVGVSAFGLRCTARFGSTFTRVGSFIEWIEEKVWSK